jgi:hypothetical protein
MAQLFWARILPEEKRKTYCGNGRCGCVVLCRIQSRSMDELEAHGDRDAIRRGSLDTCRFCPRSVANSERTGWAGQPSHGGFTVLGATVVVVMIVGLVYLSSPFWMPKRHRHAIPLNNEYANLTNTQHTFKSLSVQLPNCVLRITAPPENRHVVEVLRNVAGDFCKLEAQPDSNNAEIDMVSGSEADAVLVHLTKPVSPKDEIRDGVLGELQNILSIRFKHDMPAGSPPELIWLQVGHGYPWAKD